MPSYETRGKRAKRPKNKSPYRGRGRNTVETNPFSRGGAGNFIKQPAPEDDAVARKRGRSKLS